MESVKTHKLTLHNDDVNSYSYVMACLIKFCNHHPLQAEQCALIANNNGKCDIKSGDFMEMFELQTTFNDVNIKTEVEVYESSMH
jgi:ATP-dependent Clp protease adaptor protein ClpS